MPERFRIIGAARHGIERRGVPRAGPRGGRGLGPPALDAEAWERFAESLRFAGVGDGSSSSARRSRDARERARGRAAGAALSLAAAARGGRTVEALGEVRARRGRAGDHREALRHRPRVGPCSSTRRCTRSSTSAASSASTTTSAGRRCRTCSRCASPTACSSRSGTATTSTTSRSTSPRRSRSRCGAASTRKPAPSATWSSPISSRCSASSRWSRRPRWSRRRSAIEREKVFDSMPPLRPENVVRGQYARLSRGGRRRRRTPTPRPSSRSRPSSTTGAGRGCRSTCAPASAWPRAGTC